MPRLTQLNGCTGEIDTVVAGVGGVEFRDCPVRSIEADVEQFAELVLDGALKPDPIHAPAKLHAAAEYVRAFDRERRREIEAEAAAGNA